MYLEHFGLRTLPFENVPDPAFFFDEGDYQRILRRLASAIASGRGLMVVAGPIGSGKTTLSQKLMSGLPESTVQLWLAEPPGTDRELFQLLLQRLGARFAWDSRVLALGILRDMLLKLHARGGQCLVIVDESHKFSDEGLEAIRLLNNLEQGGLKLIQVLMLGQEELASMLTGTGREAFRQRIANFEVLGRMDPPQVCDYVGHRLRVAGGDPAIFTDLVLEAVAAACGGIPRLINSLCDRALLHAFEGGKAAVDTKDLLKAAEDVGVYRKAFHFLVGRERTETAAPTPAAAPAPAPAPAPVSGTQEAAACSAATVKEENRFGERHEPPRRLAGPLVFLASGAAALAASLYFYCSRATVLNGGDCLAHLVREIFGR
ncbi:MAG: ExeA family protein [Candidatus Methylomirabilia bacterium]